MRQSLPNQPLRQAQTRIKRGQEGVKEVPRNPRNPRKLKLPRKVPRKLKQA
jgi:hypothetical protein